MSFSSASEDVFEQTERTFLKSIRIFFTRTRDRFRSVLRYIWDKGIGNLIANKRWGKLILDIGIISLWITGFYLFTASSFVGVFGILCCVILLAKIFKPDGDGFLKEFISPFVTMMTVSVATIFYILFKEAVFILACFMIPVLTKEIEEFISNIYKKSNLKVIS